MYLERSGVNGYSVQYRVDAVGMAIFSCCSFHEYGEMSPTMPSWEMGAYSRLLHFHVGAEELVVESLPTEEFVVGAFLDELTTIEDEDPFDVLKRGKAMCNCDNRTPCKVGVEVPDNALFAQRIERTAGFIEDKNPCIRKEQPCESDLEALPT